METRLKLPAAALAAVLSLAGCVPPPFPVPPPLPAEVIPLPPVSEGDLMWQPGDWAFAAGSYRYEPGHYVPAEGHGRNWMFAHWAPVPEGVIWVAGGWVP